MRSRYKNSSSAHIWSHQQVPKTFDTFKIFKTRKFHKIQSLRNFACPPSFDFACSSVRPHAKKNNSFTVLRLISVIMSAHFWGYITYYEPTSHIEVEHTVSSTAGKIALYFQDPKLFHFLLLSRLNLFWVFWKNSSFVCTFLMILKTFFLSVLFFRKRFFFAPHFFQTRIHISHHMHLVRQILIHVKF